MSTLKKRLVRKLEDESAFSMVEALMAMTIMSLVLIGLLGLLVTSIKAVTVSKHSTLATQIANESIEKIRAMNYEAVTSFNETRTVSGVRFTIVYDVQWVDDAADGTGAADTDSSVQDYKQVLLSVSWLENDTTRTVNASTFIKSKPASTEPPTVNFVFDDTDTATAPDPNKTPPDGTVFGTTDSPYAPWFDAGQIPIKATATDPDYDLVTMHFSISLKTPAGGFYNINPTNSFTNSPPVMWNPNLKNESDTPPSDVWGEGTHEVSVVVWDAHGNRDAKSVFWTIDREAPAAPSNLVAVPAGSSSISLSWQAARDGLDMVKRYQVYRRGPGEDSFSMVAERDFDPAGPSHIDNGLSPWSAYEYYVVALSPGGRPSTASNTAIASTAMNLAATVTGSGNSRTVNLNWAPVPSAAADSFKIYRDGVLRASVSNGSATTYADSASKNTTYRYYVEAYKNGARINLSSTITVNTN